ncbi:unnamed protein product [Allacma fusca]|uniref:Plethodontid modulating factor n=1 Tax=Allacma fusca TaxID=39272 RepID=A0A8J2NWX3_9HEXA|nr:unnamed protein product [Allacma fusca]
MNRSILLFCFLGIAALVVSKPADSGEMCQSYEMDCVFSYPHNGTTIHNKGAILDDCRCDSSRGRLECSNELLKPEAKNCNCRCKE